MKQLSNKELKALSDKIASNIQRVLGHFGIPIQDFGEYISCACPIHDGDNPNAFTMTIDSEHSYFGIWKCWTQGCEEDNINTPIGLIRALLSKFQDKEITFNEAVDFSMKLVETNFEDLVKSSNNMDFNKKSLCGIENNFKKREQNKKSGVNRSVARKALSRPAKYYLDRGYSESVLDEFDVGVCSDSRKQMRDRVVAPVYDDDFECMVGCVGRIMHENYNGRKWVNSKKFYAGAWLYGYWLSRDYIKSSRMAVLVEGQGDVWRLWEAGIKNVVGMFGSGLTDTQIRILETSGATTLVLLPDNDEAGAKANRKIYKKCSSLFDIVTIDIDLKDVGEMTIEQINKQIKPIIEDIDND